MSADNKSPTSSAFVEDAQYRKRQCRCEPSLGAMQAAASEPSRWTDPSVNIYVLPARSSYNCAAASCVMAMSVVCASIGLPASAGSLEGALAGEAAASAKGARDRRPRHHHIHSGVANTGIWHNTYPHEQAASIGCLVKTLQVAQCAPVHHERRRLRASFRKCLGHTELRGIS
ncbi:hypothetical protein MRX96_017427 [Rhipicephalus microplus]